MHSLVWPFLIVIHMLENPCPGVSKLKLTPGKSCILSFVSKIHNPQTVLIMFKSINHLIHIFSPTHHPSFRARLWANRAVSLRSCAKAMDSNIDLSFKCTVLASVCNLCNTSKGMWVKSCAKISIDPRPLVGTLSLFSLSKCSTIVFIRSYLSFK